MKRALLGLIAVLALAPSVSAAPKQKKPDKASEKGKQVRLKILVVDVADGRAYITPGAKEGLRVGDQIDFGKLKYGVVAVADSSAVLVMDDQHPLAVGDKGRITVELGREEKKVERLQAPPPLSTFKGSWTEAKKPSLDQHPKPVPLGLIEDNRRNRAAISLSGYGVSGGGESFGRAELRAQLHYEPFVSAPFAMDVDVSGQTWFMGDRRASDARPAVRVRQLELSYGQQRSWFGALGRLRYASSFLGQLDGVRVRAPIAGGLSLTAFGGAVPEPLSGVPSSTARFGGELGWEELDWAWRPRVIVGGHASRFDGKIDERRLNASIDLMPQFGHFGTFAEVSFFDADNPWGASTTELSAAGIDADGRAGVVELSAWGRMQQPERSNWLAAFLPPEFLCIAGTSATSPSPCLGSGAVYTGGGEAGLRFDKASVSVGGNASVTQNTTSTMAGGYANTRLIDLVGTMRIDAGVAVSRGTFLNTVAGTLSPGVELLDRRLDLSARYRPALVRYRADESAFLEHLVGAAVWVAPSRSFDLSLDADKAFGSDVDVFVVQGLATWRPEI
ncbi:MAG: hypothetical protein KC776_08790 [Myxococcales bacterium]|nr:hypothetical protein [Myxococcales bacterium]MCB9576321.1 hypothetical protein [Polyangiaceae bacterium]